jgi:hypothetical protein
MIRLRGAFVTRLYEEWEASRAANLHRNKPPYNESHSFGDEHRRVEYFLEAMKYEIAKVIFPEVVPNGQYHPSKATNTQDAPQRRNYRNEVISLRLMLASLCRRTPPEKMPKRVRAWWTAQGHLELDVDSETRLEGNLAWELLKLK